MTTSDPTIFERELDISFERMAQILPDITSTALNVGAYIIKDKVKGALASKVPNATRPIRKQTINGKYEITGNDTLIDAVRQGKFDRMTNSTKVHILGANKKGSGQFITRFFEAGTKARQAKTYKGKKLKTPRATGQLGAYNFFVPTVESTLPEAINIMQEVLDNKITQALENGQ